MAKRTRTTIIRDNPDDDVDVVRGNQPPEPEDSEEQSYSEFMAKNRGVEGCRVKIRRQTPQGRQFCISEPPEAIESIEEYLAAYHSKQSWATEEGVYFVSVDVRGETRSSFCVRIAPMSHTPVVSGGMAVSSDPNTRILERIEQRLSVQEKPPMMEMVDGLAKLDQLRGGSNSGALNLDNMVKLIEIGSRMNGGGPVDAGWEGMLRDVLKDNAPAIIGLLQMGAAKLASLGAKQPPQPAAMPSQPPPQQPQPPTVGDTMEPDEQERLILQQGISYLKKKALAHSEPGLYVDLIIDNREDPLYGRLISKIVENDFQTFVATVDPEIGKPEYVNFFGFIHDRIRRLFKPANTVAGHTGGKGGNKGHSSSNGDAGKASGQ